MEVKMVFKANIMTEESYPSSMELKFARMVTDSEDIFKDVYDYVDTLLNAKVVSCDIECLGFTEVRQAKMWEMCELARQGIERL